MGQRPGKPTCQVASGSDAGKFGGGNPMGSYRFACPYSVVDPNLPACLLKTPQPSPACLNAVCATSGSKKGMGRWVDGGKGWDEGGYCYSERKSTPRPGAFAPRHPVCQAPTRTGESPGGVLIISRILIMTSSEQQMVRRVERT